jgi:hypothetical protein
MMALQRRTFAASSEMRPQGDESSDTGSKRKQEPLTAPREQRKLALEKHVNELALSERCSLEVV